MSSPQEHRPPQFWLKFLRWYCSPEYLEDIEGDLVERFEVLALEGYIQKANRQFIRDVLVLFRPSIIRSNERNQKLNSYLMLKNDLKIAWRTMLRQKLYTTIKIGGFALGIAACLLISLYIRHEASYDQQYDNKDRIYRVIGEYLTNGTAEQAVWFPAPFANALEDDFPEVIKAGRYNSNEIHGAGAHQVRRTDRTQNTFDNGFAYIDQELIEIMEIDMLEGNLETALAEPNTLVISEQKADKYFPEGGAVGKQLILNDNEELVFTIGGVMANRPTSSHFQYEFLMTMTGREFWPGEQTFWLAQNYRTYVLLDKNVDPRELEPKLLSIVEKYYLPSLRETGNVDAESIMGNIRLLLQPITDIHLYSNDIHDDQPRGDYKFIWLFGIIAVFILIIASINFINLSTAKSANRAKEVGLRKVIGSDRWNLVKQFLIESILYSVLSLIIGLVLMSLFLPYFNSLAGRSLSIPLNEWWIYPTLLIAAVIVGIFAGLYPSFYLSSFQPIRVLKGSLSLGARSSGVRSALVIFQFAISIILIAGTLIVNKQMSFILNKKLGFNKEQVILLRGTNTLNEQVEPFKQELLRLANVASVSISDYLPIADTKRNGNSFWLDGRDKIDSPVGAQNWRVDHDYLKTLRISLLEGRNFDRTIQSDSTATIINYTMAKELNILDDPLGQKIINQGGPYHVIGVVEDFHFESMKDDIRGLCLFLGNSPSMMSIRASTNDLPLLTQSIEEIWDEFAPHQSIQYSFLDDTFAMMYADVKRIQLIFTVFAVLGIVVACLGLFGLSAFMAEQRHKEIGIRLAMGASGQHIFRLLTGNFVRLILISMVIAIPIAWIMMQDWLDEYAYRIEITWELFAIASSLSLLIAMITISYESVKAATVSPAECLRTE